jgi:WD40 repeat protein
MERTQAPVIKLKTAFEIAFSPDEDYAAFFGGRNVSVMYLAASKSLFSVHPIAHPSHIDFSPDGRRLAVKSTSGRTIILDAQTGQTVQDFRNQKEGEGSHALFSSCGRYVVSVSWRGLLSVRDTATSELVFSHVHGNCMLNNLTEPPPPETVVVYPWPIHGHDCRELHQRWSFIGALQVSPSGRFLGVVHGAPPQTIDIYDMERSRIAASRAIHFGGTGCSIGWSPDEGLLAIMGNERCFVLEMPDLAVRHKFPLRYGCYARFSPSSRFLALGSWSTSFIVPLDCLTTFVESRSEDA